MVVDLALQDRVEFIPPKSRDELAKLYASFDVLVLPSHTDYFWKEQYGRVLVEAMACRTPVVGSRSGAIPVVIGNQERCFSEGNISAMKSVVTKLIEKASDSQDQAGLKERAQFGDIHLFANAFMNLHFQIAGEKR
jgi:glycosyltransferase involved in cell wall biosynthesis